jgi:hypothetical protein
MDGPAWRRRALPALLLLGAAGCDVPTELSWWETRWVLPSQDTRVGPESFLPEGVTLSEDGTAFLVPVDELGDSQTLGELCPACLPLDGLEAPKPPFQGTLGSFGPMATDVDSTSLELGSVHLEIHNGLSFDPIRPGPVHGAVEVQVRDGSPEGRLLADSVIGGDVEAFPPGTTKALELDLAPGPVEEGIFIEVLVDSPAGDPADIRAEERMSFVAGPGPLRVTGARVRPNEADVTLDESALEVGDLDPRIVERVLDGAVEVRVSNPFAVTLDLDIRIHGPATPELVRSLTIVPGSSQARLRFTGAELQSFLGKEAVILDGGGVVRPDVETIYVTPDLEVNLGVTLDLILRMGAGT